MGVDASSPNEGWIQVRHGTIAGATYPLALQPIGGNVEQHGARDQHRAAERGVGKIRIHDLPLPRHHSHHRHHHD